MLPEVQLYLERLQDRRAEMLKALDGLDADALDWKPLSADANSVTVLAVHSLGAERRWLHEVVGGTKIQRDRDAEFRTRAADVGALKAMYAAAALESEQILTQLSAEDMDATRKLPKDSCTVRWAILHVLEHYSEHLAQMWLTRQLWENRASRPHEI
ncbi:MAG: DUF664 domain-containing protein [Chloroflexi bacterium]|nr:DUF664 domain-containing protein [Chloroflexota bacterium]